MDQLIVLIPVAAVLVTGAAGLSTWVLVRHGRRQTAAAEQAAAEAARLAADAATAQLSADREVVMQAAVDTVVSVAGDKLRDQLSAGSKELELRHDSFEQRVSAMADSMARVGELVGELQRDRVEQHGQLVERLEAAARTQSELADTTQQLRHALASPKARGQWGERMAEDVLRLAGMAEGVNYRKQTALAGGTIPDFTFLMPQGLALNMDVKFPLDNYLRYLEAESEADREGARKAFVRDVRNRLKEITTRDYIDPETTVNCALLFIPNESIYSFIHEHDPGLSDHALEHRVVLCSPFTLFAVLGVIRQAIDSFVLQRTSGEILECLGAFRKEWDKFSGQLDKTSKHLDTAQRSFEELSGRRRRVLERELERIDGLREQTDTELSAAPVEALPHLREVSAG